MYLCNYFRGRAGNLPDLLNMEVGHVAILNKIAYDESQEKNAADKKKNQALEDAIEESM